VVTLKRVKNILKYGLGEKAYQRKKAAKNRVRVARFHSQQWQSEGDLTTRRYNSYEEYLAHQAAKLERISHRLEENEERTFQEFVDRLSGCAPLKPMRSVLCLGARTGAEVRALIRLGHFAVGIDLNPGPRNTYVLTGDFHGLVFADDSIDAVYTNSLDHVFDLRRLLDEVRRVLRPGGIFVAELLAGYEEGFTPGDYEATHWRTVESMVARIRDEGGLDVVDLRPLGRLWRGEYTQAVFAKPAAAA
jgi:SAM-dependent methyltransferase